jgi:DNA adenine methylase
MNEKGAYLMLSNSDPKNADKNDNFFDDLYKNYSINRIAAKRHINSNTSKRGEINELIITNYL